jgi:hypothetical protein
MHLKSASVKLFLINVVIFLKGHLIGLVTDFGKFELG